MAGTNRLRVVGIMMAVAVLLGVSACTSVEPSRDDGPTPRAEPTDPSSPDDKPVSKKYAELVATARDEGDVSVIVRLKLDSTPAADRAHQQAIAEAIQDMYDQLDPYDFRKQTTFELYPMFSGSVDETALRYLIDSDDVERVWENRSIDLE